MYIVYQRGSENKGWVIAVRAIKIIHCLGRWRPDNNRQRNRVVNMLMILELSLSSPVAFRLRITSSSGAVFLTSGVETRQGILQQCFFFRLDRCL